MDCAQNNQTHCNCSYVPCSRKGKCCECISYHVRNQELPACAFSKDAEKTYDRSFHHFAKLINEGKA
ncbi:MAG TPA: DUF6485 family protein [Spirochaetota bacterium]